MERKTVKNVRKLDYIPEYVYNIRVEGNRNYFANNILVHNCDDPNNAKDIESDAEREAAIDWWDNVWSTRLNNIENDCMIVVQQRLHKKDISGHILEHDIDGDWTKYILPMEFESRRRCKTIVLPSTYPKVWEDPRKEEGEILCPNYITPTGLERLKKRLRTSSNIAGQLQMSPYAAEGDMIKAKWFQWWKEASPPEIIHTIQSWDTALTDKKSSAYSAQSTWGLFYDKSNQVNIILLSAYRKQVMYPELRARAKLLYFDYRDDGNHVIKPDNNHKPDFVLVENKSTGGVLIQDFKIAGIPAIGFNPDKYGDKTARVSIVSHFLECGRVWVPAMPPDYIQLRPFAESFVASCVAFPQERDWTDSMVQVLIRLQESWDLRNESDGVSEDTSIYLDKPVY